MLNIFRCFASCASPSYPKHIQLTPNNPELKNVINGCDIEDSVIAALLTDLPKLSLSDQDNIFDLFKERILQAPKQLPIPPHALAIALQFFTFTYPERQIMIAKAIWEEKLGDISDVLNIVIGNPDAFEPEKLIAMAICNSDPDVNPDLNPATQKWIAQTFLGGKLDMGLYMLKALAEKLYIFTDPKTIVWIAQAFLDKKFATDPAVLKALAENLDIFKDNGKAQKLIELAISQGRFDKGAEALKIAREKLDISVYQGAQSYIEESYLSRTTI